ncbi:CTP synthase C-terminal region-related (seleno)protein [Paenibacillus medicaginis]|uniref:CTP synthase (glutamine hydrolyzing) n=1 Tax=Paenibacillus medicaginis TaxID=1470560 RepID=A0ABV5BY69_9BACL
MCRIGLIGDFNEEVTAHRAIPQAIQLAAKDLGMSVSYEWVATPTLEQNVDQKLSGYDAIWAVPASPYQSMQGAFNGIQYAREQQIPFLGTCGGFQHMVIEFARNVMGLAEADHAEDNPAASIILVAPLSCSVSEQVHTFTLTPGSKTAKIYDSHEIHEQYGICNYGLNSEFAPSLEKAGLRIVGTDLDGEVRIMELDHHPFFVGTLFQPERSVLKNITHPLIKAFLRAAGEK